MTSRILKNKNYSTARRKTEEIKGWISLTKEEKILIIKESLERYVLFDDDDWVIVECQNPDKTLIMHIPSGQFRLFMQNYNTSVAMFSQLTDEDKQKMLVEIMFE